MSKNVTNLEDVFNKATMKNKTKHILYINNILQPIQYNSFEENHSIKNSSALQTTNLPKNTIHQPNH